MPTLDVASLLGRSFGEGLRATSLLVVGGMVVVGTDAGCVLGFAQPGVDVDSTATCASGPAGAAGICVYAQTVHYGPVHCLCASTAHLVASAGHDAEPVVQPLANLLSNSTERVSRLRGHTLPVTAMTFFSTGTWLTTCGLGGRLIVFDALARTPLCDVSVGFSVRCLALSPDETACYVGGTQLARVDLYDNDRPVEPLVRRNPPAWLQLYSWACNDDDNSNDGGFVAEAPADLFIARLAVTPEKVTAFFEHRGNGTAGGASATWLHGAADFWLSRDFQRVCKDKQHFRQQQQKKQRNQQFKGIKEKEEEVCGPQLHLPFNRLVVEEGDGAPPVLRAYDGWDTWRRPRVRVVRRPALRVVAPAAHATGAAGTLDQRLALQEERGRQLQAECDELVRRLKEEMKRRSGKKRRRASILA
ncbi:hypothetical protein DQ04_00951050 [Trypanosoma grayi]|uniref:hypothetical protein n=1 Tax=Trypanosoma grayi TaxID=71804 RepID=UPI0004F43C6C|nr:hypothetical protein DQ04_00951050 [Trypanosoma grayi]KEG13529.1 hypothetical protein DQ04_00951050 [Trypanosoma grayi]